jgi:ABC-type sugar transport system ATPase subunit
MSSSTVTEPQRHQGRGGSSGLSLTGVAKAFGAVQALTDVSLDVSPGEVVALVGENGAGKSTLLRILEGDQRPDRGTVAIAGSRVSLGDPLLAKRLGIRVVHQEPEIVGGISVAENLYIGELPRTRMRRLRGAELIRTAQAHLDQLEIGEVSASALGDDLSIAQRQLVEIAKAMKPGLRVLALDEPTSSLAEDQVERLLAAVKRFTAQGVAVLYVSHRLREALALADRVAILRDGHLVEQRPTAGTTQHDLVRLMVGRDLASVFPDRPDRTGQPEAPVVLSARGLCSDRLRGIDLDLRAGEIVGVAGLIGSGRSRLAKTLFGAQRLTTGTIRLHGKEVKLRSARDAIRAGIGLAPEDRRAEALFNDLSVAENATISVLDRVRAFRVIQRGKQRAIAAELVTKLRVKTPSLQQPVSALSGGNAQKVVLARWLAVQPQVLILDEPTRGIDVGAKSEIYHLVRQLADDGLAILLISSELPEVLGMSDRIVIMRDGRIVGEADPRTASEESILRVAMLEDGADVPTADIAQEAS